MSGRGLSSRLAMWEGRTETRPGGGQAAAWHDGMSLQQRLVGHDASYGRPAAGSLTERRGRQAGVHISGEVVQLCGVIEELGERQDDGTVSVTFGVLFDAYTRLSNKLVGMLLRARKQGLVAFEGEMLYQRRDDDVPIRLLCRPTELKEDVDRRKCDLATSSRH